MTTFAMPRPTPAMRVLLALTASSNAVVELTPTALQVRLGLTWRADVPRERIVRAERDDTPTASIGAHGWGGRWLVNTSTRGLVVLEIDPPAAGRCLGVRHTLSQLRISLDDPEAFLHELGVSSSA